MLQRVFPLFALTFAAGLTASAASAEAVSNSFELFAGAWQFKEAGDSREFTYGLRAGHRVSDRLGLEASLGRFEDSERILDTRFDIRFLLADLSVKAYLNPGGKAETYVFGGPGWAFIDSKVGGDQGQGDSFTVHAGIAADIHLGEHAYLRPDFRSHWYQKGDRHTIDLVGSVALGFKF